MLPLTYEQFIAKFPEFQNTDRTLVLAHLADALLEIDSSIWGPKLAVAQGYLAAHTLTLSPFGQNVRMAAKDGTTTYNTHYKRLQRQVSSGGRVV